MSAGIGNAFLGKPPPHDIEAELHVIGAVFIRPEVLDDFAFLEPGDFYVETNEYIYGAMCDLWQKGRKPTPVAVFAQLRVKGRHKDIHDTIGGEDLNGIKLLQGIARHIVTAGGARTHADIVKQQAKLRSAMGVGLEIIEEATRGEVGDVEEWVTGKIGTLEGLSQRSSEEPKGTQERMLQLMHDIEEHRSGGDGPRTGFVDLDALLPRGMQGSRLIILAGRPEVGKSTLASNISNNVAASGVAVLRFALEMRMEDETAREISAVGNVEAQRIVEPEYERDVLAAARQYYNGNFGTTYITDKKTSFAEISACCRSMVRKKKIGLVVIDHLGLVQHWNKKATTERQVSEHTIGLKQLAMSLDVPFLVLCHLNRQCDYRDNKRPVVADLRSSGEIEGSADTIFMMYREAIYYPECGSDIAEVLVRKNRSGTKGTAYMWFRGAASKFQSATQEDAWGEVQNIQQWHESQRKGKRRLTTRSKNGEEETWQD